MDGHATTADGVPYSPGMPLWTLEGHPVPEGRRDLPRGDTTWVEWGRGGAVVDVLYSSAEAARADRESPTNRCFACGTLLGCAGPARPRAESTRALDGGLVFRATGNYGSTLLDPADGRVWEIVVCDRCAAARTDRVARIGH
jgi:hypothetical protein